MTVEWEISQKVVQDFFKPCLWLVKVSVCEVSREISIMYSSIQFSKFISLLCAQSKVSIYITTIIRRPYWGIWNKRTPSVGEDADASSLLWAQPASPALPPPQHQWSSLLTIWQTIFYCLAIMSCTCSNYAVSFHLTQVKVLISLNGESSSPSPPVFAPAWLCVHQGFSGLKPTFTLTS